MGTDPDRPAIGVEELSPEGDDDVGSDPEWPPDEEARIGMTATIIAPMAAITAASATCHR